MAKVEGNTPIKKVQDVAQQAAKEKTTSRPTRHYRAELFQAALISATAAFALLTILVKSAPSLPLDIQITRAIQSIQWPPFAMLMTWVSWPGFLPQSLIITALISLLIYSFGLRWEAVTALLGAIFSTLVNGLVKALVQRPRPGIDLVHVFAVLNSYSFPSGHVMFYVGFFGFLWFLSYTVLKTSLLRTFLLAFFGALILLIGMSRVYLGQHWPSDVLGAYLLGSLTLVGIIYFYRWGKTRYFVDQPVAPEKPKTTQQSAQ